MKKEIIQVTYEAFAEKGYSATLSEISGRLGLKKSSLYNYFDNKEELFLEMIEIKLREHYNEQMINLSSYENLEAIEQLESIFRHFIASFEDIKKLKFWKRLLLIKDSSLLEKTKEVIRKNEYEFTKKLREILLDILKNRPDLEKHHDSIILSYGSLIFGVLDGYLLYGNGIKYDQYIDAIWNFYYQGLQCYLKDDFNK